MVPGFIGEQGKSYIAASYVKYLESAGARVVPVLWNASDDSLRATFAGLNGLLFPGGGQDLVDYDAPFLMKARLLYDLVTKANSMGDYFPLWVRRHYRRKEEVEKHTCAKEGRREEKKRKI